MISKVFWEILHKSQVNMGFFSDFFKNIFLCRFISGPCMEYKKTLIAQWWMDHLCEPPITQGLGNFTDAKTEEFNKQWLEELWYADSSARYNCDCLHRIKLIIIPAWLWERISRFLPYRRNYWEYMAVKGKRNILPWEWGHWSDARLPHTHMHMNSTNWIHVVINNFLKVDSNLEEKEGRGPG